MPLYEYRCDACNHLFEVIQKFSDAPIGVCPSCGGGPIVKLLSSPAIQFKGSGWYITDYARKDQAKSGKGAESAKSDPGAAGEGSKSGDAGKSGESSTPASSGSSSSSATPAASGPSKA